MLRDISISQSNWLQIALHNWIGDMFLASLSVRQQSQTEWWRKTAKEKENWEFVWSMGALEITLVHVGSSWILSSIPVCRAFWIFVCARDWNAVCVRPRNVIKKFFVEKSDSFNQFRLLGSVRCTNRSVNVDNCVNERKIAHRRAFSLLFVVQSGRDADIVVIGKCQVQQPVPNGDTISNIVIVGLDIR